MTHQGDCKQNGLACVRYQRGQCTDCLPGFKLKGNVCDMEGCKTLTSTLQCSECESKKYLNVKGVCQMKNCLSWKDGDCQICNQGYNYQ